MAIPISIRGTVVQRRLQGESLASIAVTLSLKYQTVRKIWRRYRLRGVASLTPDYHRRKRRRNTLRRRTIRAACWLKRHHPTWSARVIRECLLKRWPDRTIPGERSLQRGFREAGVDTPGRGRGIAAEKEEENRQWMLNVLRCKESDAILRSLVASDEDCASF